MKAVAVDRTTCVRCGMEGHRASNCPRPVARAHVLASAWNDRCTGCMEGQGRVCVCRKPAQLPRLSTAAALRLVWAADLAVVVLVGWLAWRAWA